MGRDHEEELDHLVEAQRTRGLESYRLTADEVFEREPHLSGWVTGGLLAADDLQVDPRALVLALAAATRNQSGLIVEGAEVESLEAEAGSLRHVVGRLNGRAFSVACDVAVVAAGAWSSTGLQSPASEMGVRPVKGQTVRLQGQSLIRHVLRSPEVYLVARESGELVIGATVEEQGFDSRPTAGAAMDLLRKAWHVLPGIYDCPLLEVSVGLRPAARDHMPLIGATEMEGVFVATGHYRHGILLTPITAVTVADLIADGQESTLLAPFSPQRILARSR